MQSTWKVVGLQNNSGGKAGNYDDLHGVEVSGIKYEKTDAGPKAVDSVKKTDKTGQRGKNIEDNDISTDNI